MDVIDKSKWVLRLIGKLWKQKFSGTVMLDFHDGNLSGKFRTQQVHTASDLMTD